MIWSKSTWMRVFAAAAFVFAVFILSPAVEAATCAPEAPSAHAAIDHDPVSGDHDDDGVRHGVCSHGHCHHVSPGRIEETASVKPPYASLPVLNRHGAEKHASALRDRLKRPPRD